MFFNPWKSHDPFSNHGPLRTHFLRTVCSQYAPDVRLYNQFIKRSIIFLSHTTPKVPSSSRFVNFMSEYFLSAGAEVRFEMRSDSFTMISACIVLYRRANKTPPSGIVRFVTVTISMQTFEYTIKRLLWASTQRGTSECGPQRWILLPFVSSTLQWRPP